MCFMLFDSEHMFVKILCKFVKVWCENVFTKEEFVYFLYVPESYIPLKSRPMDKIILGKLLLLPLAKASPSQRSLLFHPFPDLGIYNSGLYTSVSNLIPHYNGSSLCLDCLLKTVIKTKTLSHQRSYFPESVGNFRIKLPLGLVFLFHSWPQRISINFFRSHLFVWFLFF